MAMRRSAAPTATMVSVAEVQRLKIRAGRLGMRTVREVMSTTSRNGRFASGIEDVASPRGDVPGRCHKTKRITASRMPIAKITPRVLVSFIEPIPKSCNTGQVAMWSGNRLSSHCEASQSACVVVVLVSAWPSQ